MLMKLATLTTVLVISLSACTSTRYTEHGNQITIHGGIGGKLSSIRHRYNVWKHQGRELIIDGQVISADAIEAFSYPGACYTENAVFSPHAVSSLYSLGRLPLRYATEREARRLPPALEEWWRGDLSFYNSIGFARVKYPQLLEIWPEGACNQDDALADLRGF